MATSIYTAILLGHDAEADALIFVSIGLAFAAVLASEILLRERRS
jgi:ABC-type molybdate transport system permease subunit